MNNRNVNNYQPYMTGKHPFAYASVTLGAVSALTFTSIVPAVSAASLAIIFAMLSRKGTGKIHPLAKIGTICASISLVLGLSLGVFYVHSLPSLLKQPEFQKELDKAFDTFYGQDVNTEELLNHLGILPED